MMVEKRQVKLAANAEATERALSRLVRVVNRIDQLRRERKRLLKPRPFQEQPEVAAGLNDELPSPLDYLANGSKPDALGYRAIDPQRWEATKAAMRDTP